MNWKFTDSTNLVVSRTLADGRMESCLVVTLATDIAPLPADVPTLAQNIAAKWEQIKAERERRRFDGGAKVGTLWYLSTAVATTEYNALLHLAAGIPLGTVLRTNWRSMSGDVIDMTPALVKSILNAGFAQIAAIDDAAQVHRTAMEASADPAAYDYSTGWPLVFGE